MRAWMWICVGVAGLTGGACFDGRFMLHKACRGDAECVQLACVDGFCGGPPPDEATTGTTGDEPTTSSPTTGPAGTCGDGVVGPGEACDGVLDDPAQRCVACVIASCPPGYHLVDETFCSEPGATLDVDACLSTCMPDTCGDGLLNTYEQCDDGNPDNSDACLVTCAEAACGDGFVQTGVELCDDGNKANGDSCDQRCTVPTCGDGQPNDGEECDDGNLVDGDACRNVCVAARCGDGVVQAGVEQCDDGDDPADDSCDACIAAVCGDGIVQAGEVCDDANSDNTDACIDDCDAASCGDGFVQTGVELCDEGDANGDGPCDADCVLTTCGDGVVQPGEQCDDANDINTDACLEICIDAFCGDAFVHADVEQCDAGPYNPAIGCVNDCKSYTPITDLAAGPFTTCAIVEGGVLHCWGRNAQCQLGLGTSAPVGDDEPPGLAPPVPVPPVSQVVLGRDHSCALLADASVRCWGTGPAGQLGYHDNKPRGCTTNSVPAKLEAVEIWDDGETTASLAAGELHTCALSNQGSVRCWGTNIFGDLGTPDVDSIGKNNRPVDVDPVDVGGPVIQLRASHHTTCAVLATGGLRCWGANFWGSLGLGHYDAIGDDETPASAGDIPLPTAVAEVSVGSAHTCARLIDESLHCWGSNLAGELGLGDLQVFGYATPQPLEIGAPVAQIELGAALTCARMMNGALRCFGSGAEGQLANGTGDSFGLSEPAASGDPIAFALPGAVDLLAVNNGHACARLEYGALFCWGLSGDGELGYGQTANLGDEPNEVPLYRPVVVFAP